MAILENYNKQLPSLPRRIQVVGVACRHINQKFLRFNLVDKQAKYVVSLVTGKNIAVKSVKLFKIWRLVE